MKIKLSVNAIIPAFYCTEIARLQKYNAGLKASDTFEKLFIFSDYFAKKEEKNADPGEQRLLEKVNQLFGKDVWEERLVFNVSGIGEGREIGAIQLGKSTKVK